MGAKLQKRIQRQGHGVEGCRVRHGVEQPELVWSVIHTPDVCRTAPIKAVEMGEWDDRLRLGVLLLDWR